MSKKNISVILTSSSKLGKIRETVQVVRGFARHYLLPRKKARIASEAVVKELETQKTRDDTREFAYKESLKLLQKKLEGFFLGFVRSASEKGNLYGSVLPKDIVDNLRSFGFSDITVDMVVLPTPLKMLGHHSLELALDEGIACHINLFISRSDEELSEDRQRFLK